MAHTPLPVLPGEMQRTSWLQHWCGGQALHEMQQGFRACWSLARCCDSIINRYSSFYLKTRGVFSPIPILISAFELFLTSLVKEEMSQMPRGVHFTAMRGGSLASARSKTVAGIPAFMLKTYEKNKQPGLKSGLTGDRRHLFSSPFPHPDKHFNICICASCHCICFSWTAALLRGAFADRSRRQTD